MESVVAATILGLSEGGFVTLVTAAIALMGGSAAVALIQRDKTKSEADGNIVERAMAMLDRMEKERNKAEAERDTAESKLDELLDRLRVQADEIAKLQRRIEQLENAENTELARLREKVAELGRRLEEERSRSAVAEERVAELEAELAELRSSVSAERKLYREHFGSLIPHPAAEA